MTVKELIEELKKYDGNKIIRISVDESTVDAEYVSEYPNEIEIW